MSDHADELEDAKRSVIAGIELAQVTLRGSIEFRDAVEELLKGTTFEKPPSARYDFEGLYGRLRNALKAAAEGSHGWQPISTAPKDGTLVLLMDDDPPQPRTGYWMSKGQWSSVLNPTHWMPLPAPPSAPSASGGQ